MKLCTMNRRVRPYSLAFLLSGTLCSVLLGPSSARADGNLDKGAPITKANSEEVAAATGHFARARSLLISALREFDEGRAKVDPSPLVDGTAWRLSLLDRARELEKVLDPQPRVTKGGVRFQADPRLLGEAKKK
jgi:hypothetical protein